MKIPNEVKVGILAVVAIAVGIWGFKFLMGQNILTGSKTFHVTYKKIDQLQVSAPVLISGLQVGTVSNIRLDPKDLETVIVTMEVEKDLKLPDNTVAYIISMGLMGQKGIELEAPYPCTGPDCAESGDFLIGKERGLIESMLGSSDFGEYLDQLQLAIRESFDSLNVYIDASEDPKGLVKVVRNLQDVTKNLSTTTETLNSILGRSENDLVAMTENLASISGNVRNNNAHIANVIANLDSIIAQVKAGRLDRILANADQAATTADQAMQKLSGTLEQLEGVTSDLHGIIQGINRGEGSLGKLVQSEELYQNLERSTRNLELLLQDMRLNPKRYMNISVFGGGKDKYEVPEEDPAYKKQE